MYTAVFGIITIKNIIKILHIIFEEAKKTKNNCKNTCSGRSYVETKGLNNKNGKWIAPFTLKNNCKWGLFFSNLNTRSKQSINFICKNQLYILVFFLNQMTRHRSSNFERINYFTTLFYYIVFKFYIICIIFHVLIQR